ncbi:nucleotidyl transferase AbiEii/AbiGii toxin family protein [Desulfatitalea alkaliphila]|uniref:Nucleotidyl transferase AbiEii/AbiGii toxin family protein n=1 Tax=Desulfatitalea alkaliphila TaxID=2929485 RepID=A0AA41R0J9_9BACT|nr:nucleotidyl transferase AbiEii/AbiGii toxin family protein [Desulfatitalea alkaliphila]MCJ8499341.1 nucleotidyl transferase AbiEii/AbiGii toxin family protein [Desulfatitalea alkaliphila]
MNRNNKNDAHSIFRRLLNRAKTNNEDFNLLLSRYGMERLLYRLSVSPHNDRFVLKGASLFLVWKGRNYRVTRDADLLGFGNAEIEQLANVFRKICRVESQGDGMIYLPESLSAEEIREDQEYDGVRITLIGMLSRARIPLRVDIGFGDAITPAPEKIEYPTLFDAPSPLLKAYPRYTLVAEKVEAMVKLGLANSRMKDFYDLWLVSRLFSFEGKVLQNALENTFGRRRTTFPASTPFAFTPAFYADPQKTVQWKAFVKKSKPDIPIVDLSAVIADVVVFILPVIDSLKSNISFENEWLPDRGWRIRS